MESPLVSPPGGLSACAPVSAEAPPSWSPSALGVHFSGDLSQARHDAIHGHDVAADPRGRVWRPQRLHVISEVIDDGRGSWDAHGRHDVVRDAVEMLE